MIEDWVNRKRVDAFVFVVSVTLLAVLVWWFAPRPASPKTEDKSEGPESLPPASGPSSTPGPSTPGPSTPGPSTGEQTERPIVENKKGGLARGWVLLICFLLLCAFVGGWLIFRRRFNSREHSEATKQPKTKGTGPFLALENVPGDGLCLFHSLARGVGYTAQESEGAAVGLALDVQKEMKRLAGKEKDGLIKQYILNEADNVSKWVNLKLTNNENQYGYPADYPDLQQVGQAAANVTNSEIVLYDQGLKKRFDPIKPQRRVSNAPVIGLYRNGNHFQHWRNP